MLIKIRQLEEREVSIDFEKVFTLVVVYLLDQLAHLEQSNIVERNLK